MEISTLPFPFANAMDVKNQVLFLIILASFTNGKLANADLHNIASQLKVTHYDCGEMTENNLYALNQVSKCNIAPENLEVSRAKITMYTKHFRQEIKATVCRVKYQSGQWHCGSRDDSSMDATNPSTHYNSPVYRTHPHGYTFFVQFYPYGLNSAARNHASIMFALFSGDYDGLLAWPFPKRFIFQSTINSTPGIRGLSPSHPPRRYPFEGLPENQYLP